MYRSLLRPLLFRLPAETAHHIGLWGLSLLDGAENLARAMRRASGGDDARLGVDVAGLHFPNRIGLAAGLDKNAEALVGLFALGFGFVEVGTVTPRAQPGNPTPRLFRMPEQQALLNRMGFNNQGAEAMAARLRELQWRPAPVGVNLGKNKDTPLERADDDYASAAQTLAPLADYLVVNVSSPNTPGLRSLQAPEALQKTLEAVLGKAQGKPVFLKIAPDLADEGIDAAVDVAVSCRIAGLIATNTTLARPFQHRLAGEAGGLSGRPLTSRSTEVVRRCSQRAPALPVIGVGGVFSSDDVREKLDAGASLVQVYSGFVYEGPAMVKTLIAGLLETP